MSKLKIVIGSGNIQQEGWLLTDKNILDITNSKSWNNYLNGKKIDNLFSEHVWEHIGRDKIDEANKLCYENMKVGGVLRIAVPDGNHISKAYIEMVKPGGSGLGSDDHHILYTYDVLKKELENVGFVVKLVEYWDENGIFHKNIWNDDCGHVRRSAEHDKRNSDGNLNYTSLIIDAIKK